MPAYGYEFYLLMVNSISHSFAALTREILFLPLEHKIHIFSPPCNMLYLIWFGKLLQGLKCTPPQNFFFRLNKSLHLFETHCTFLN